MSGMTLIVAGAPNVAESLGGTGRFAQVLHIASLVELPGVLRSPALEGVSKSDAVWLFSDRAAGGQKIQLPALVKRLVGSGWHVVILNEAGTGRALVRENPGAGLIEAPFTVNGVLGSLSGLPGVAALPAVEWGYSPITADAAAGPVIPEAPANPFGAPAAPANPFGAPAAPADPFGAPAAPADPFGAPGAGQWPTAPTQAPTVPAAPQDPFGSPAPAFPGAGGPVGPGPADPFGVPGDPFGSPAAGPHSPAAFPVVNIPAGPGWGPEAPGADQSARDGEAFGAPAGPGAFGSGAAPAQPPAVHTPSIGRPSSPTSPAGRAVVNPFAGPGSASAAHPASDLKLGAGQGGGPIARPEMRGPRPGSWAPRRRGKVILVTSSKGGVGKSGMCLNLAVLHAKRVMGSGLRVAAVDANLQQADMGKLLTQFTPTIEDLTNDPNGLSPERFASHMVHPQGLGLSVLLGPFNPEDANPAYYTPQLYVQILDVMREMFDYIWVDTPVAELYDGQFDALLPVADEIVVIATPDRHTLMGVNNWLRAVTQKAFQGGQGVDPNRIHLLLNRTSDGIGITEQSAQDELREWRIVASLPDTPEWRNCVNHGQLIALKEYRELTPAFETTIAAVTHDDSIITTTAGDDDANTRRGFFGIFRRTK